MSTLNHPNIIQWFGGVFKVPRVGIVCGFILIDFVSITFYILYSGLPLKTRLGHGIGRKG